MRWLLSVPKYPIGARKQTIKFAFIPTFVGYDIVWLERFIKIYQYDRDPNNYYRFKWVFMESKLYER